VEELLRSVDAALGAGGSLEAALDLVARRLGCSVGTLHFLDGGRLRLAAHVGAIPEPVLAVTREIPVGKGMAGLAVERGAPVSTCDLQSDASGVARPGAKATGLRGTVCVPILDGDRPVGALGVGGAAERAFTPEEVEVLLEVGRRMATKRGQAPFPLGETVPDPFSDPPRGNGA